MTQSDAFLAIDFALDLVDRLGSAHLPWTVERLPTKQLISNSAATLVAECYDAAGVVPELIVRTINALPAIAVEFGLRNEERKGPLP